MDGRTSYKHMPEPLGTSYKSLMCCKLLQIKLNIEIKSSNILENEQNT